jgi:hypothetical protein
MKLLNLRWILLIGLLVGSVLAESLDETRKKAESGFTLAQWLLGGAYAKGNGVPKDSAEAVKWYLKAAEQGFAMAQSDLGVMYESGEGVPKDSAEAVKWYRKAAASGDAGGRFNLGISYAKGNGVTKDLIQAHMWLNLAGATEDETYADFAKMYLSRIEKEMTPDQKAEAMKLARKLFEKIPKK